MDNIFDELVWSYSKAIWRDFHTILGYPHSYALGVENVSFQREWVWEPVWPLGRVIRLFGYSKTASLQQILKIPDSPIPDSQFNVV